MKISREFILGDHILTSRDLSDGFNKFHTDPLLGLKGLSQEGCLLMIDGCSYKLQRQVRAVGLTQE